MFIAYLADPENKDKALDDFYDDVDMTNSFRSDFAIAAILKQVQDIKNAEIKEIR